MADQMTAAETHTMIVPVPIHHVVMNEMSGDPLYGVSMVAYTRENTTRDTFQIIAVQDQKVVTVVLMEDMTPGTNIREVPQTRAMSEKGPASTVQANDQLLLHLLCLHRRLQ